MSVLTTPAFYDFRRGTTADPAGGRQPRLRRLGAPAALSVARIYAIAGSACPNLDRERRTATSGRITTITANTLAELIIGGSLASMEIADEKGGTKRGMSRSPCTNGMQEALSVFGKGLCDRPGLGQESQHAITAVGNHRPIWAGNSADDGGSPDPGQSAPAESTTAEDALWDSALYGT
jgi:hypothetical protein